MKAQPNWTRWLTVMLVVLAALALVYIAYAVLSRFTQALLLFVVGAILAYIMTPLVNRLYRALRVRWLAVLVAYVIVAVAIFALGFSLFTPFINQTQSLIANLHNPSPSSLRGVSQVQRDAEIVSADLNHQLVLADGKIPFSVVTRGNVGRARNDLARLKNDVGRMSRGRLVARQPRHHGHQSKTGPNPEPQTHVPASYVADVGRPLASLEASYQAATGATVVSSGPGTRPATIDAPALRQAASQAKRVANAARSLDRAMATTPILLLRGQSWLDQHGIQIDLHAKFGQAASQVSNQGENVLNNAVTIVSETATALLDISLILIISFYLVSDGAGMVRRGVALVPPRFREQSSYFLNSLDRVLGGYIRGQLALALLAGVLGGVGAAVLHVPYPLLIGITTALLELIPVVGPAVSAVPAVLISLFFSPLTTTVILLLWFLLFQQVVTNVIGPRILGTAVGIHPLEALLAVLVGYPLGGL
ncbi:MAG: AI-2E family transporter, partial [Chloroflexota bacterium]